MTWRSGYPPDSCRAAARTLLLRAAARRRIVRQVTTGAVRRRTVANPNALGAFGTSLWRVVQGFAGDQCDDGDRRRREIRNVLRIFRTSQGSRTISATTAAADAQVSSRAPT